MTSKVEYLGDLRTECKHIQSGNTFITDAPVDNRGKGEAFSPTDTVATALASCMFTIMGIKAGEMGISLKGNFAEVTKTMASNPRRISKIEINFSLNPELDQKERAILENAARTCPVIYSLNQEIEKEINFSY